MGELWKSTRTLFPNCKVQGVANPQPTSGASREDSNPYSNRQGQNIFTALTLLLVTVEETYLVFEFDETELAAQANAQIGEWVKAFRIAFGQLSAGVERQGQGARLIVRLAFDEHEKLAHESWLSRLEREKPFARPPCG